MKMTFHEKVFSNFISIHLQDVVKTFPNVLTSKPELTHTWKLQYGDKIRFNIPIATSEIWCYRFDLRNI